MPTTSCAGPGADASARGGDEAVAGAPIPIIPATAAETVAAIIHVPVDLPTPPALRVTAGSLPLPGTGVQVPA